MFISQPRTRKHLPRLSFSKRVFEGLSLGRGGPGAEPAGREQRNKRREKERAKVREEDREANGAAPLLSVIYQRNTRTRTIPDVC